MHPPSDPIEFGSFRLTASRHILERAGAPVALSARAFEMLQLLIEARDRVVSRDEIMARVWPGLVVEPSNITVQMSALRRALDDAGPQPQLITTVPGRGYRFVGQISGAASDPDTERSEPGSARQAAEEPPRLPTGQPQPRVRRAAALTLGGATLLAVAGAVAWHETARPPAPALSLVVMPLRDLSDRPGQSYLADAISDDLTTDLAQLPGSTVIARETADSYKGRAVPVTQIGRDLHARYLLEGSIRSEDAVLHVNAQLIDTASGAHLSAQKFDVPRTDPGLARDTIVRRIASSLNVKLIDVESARARRDRPDDPTALDLFFQARSVLDHDDSLAGFRAAQSLLERAITLQPNFVDAIAELSTALVRKTLSVEDSDSEVDTANARALATRALSLSPRHPVALAARAQLLYSDGHTGEAAYAARNALDAEPANLGALAVLARCSWDQGHLDESARLFETILRLNPNGATNKPRFLVLGNIRLMQGRYPEAIDLAQRAIAGDPPPSPGVDSWGRAEGAHTLLIAALALTGQMQDAQALYARFAELWPHRTVWRIGALANRPLARLPGFVRFLDALHQAGMPITADEHADNHVRPSVVPLPAEAFLATPLTLPGAETIDTPRLAVMARQVDAPLILDVGGGAAVMPGAIVRSPSEQAEDDNSFVDAALQRARPRAGTPVVVMGDGTYGSAAYNAALYLLSSKRRRVVWYRGGEEAWAASGGSYEDQRQ